MLSPGPNSPSELDALPSDGTPTVIYDLETGTAASRVSDLPGFTPPEPEDPLTRDIKRMLAPVRAIGNGITKGFKRSAAEFKNTVALVRSDKGILGDLLRLILSTAALRLLKVLPFLVAAVLVPLIIVEIVKTHKKHHPKVPITFSENHEDDPQPRTLPEGRVPPGPDLAKAFDPAPVNPGSAQDAPPQPDPVDASSDADWQTLKSATAHLIARLELDSLHAPGASPGRSSGSSAVPPGQNATSGNPGVPGTPQGVVTSADQAPVLAAPGGTRSAAPAPLTAAGVGANQPWSNDPSSAADYDNPDGFTNGDENAILLPLYKEYKAHPKTALGREAGIDLAELYWYRAEGAVRDGHTAIALTDWKRVVAFDGTAPIAKVARQQMRMHGAATHPKRHASKTTAQARKRHPVALGHPAKAKSHLAQRHHA